MAVLLYFFGWLLIGMALAKATETKRSVMRGIAGSLAGMCLSWFMSLFFDFAIFSMADYAIVASVLCLFCLEKYFFAALGRALDLIF